MSPDRDRLLALLELSRDTLAIDWANLSTALHVVRTCLAPELLEEAGWRELHRRVGGWPGAAAHGLIGFELPLGDPRGVADFALRVIPGSPFAEWIARSGEMPAAAAALRAMGREGSPLAATRDFCIEVDVGAGGGQGGQPGVFFCNLLRGDVIDVEGYVEAAARSTGWTLDAGERAAVAAVAAAAPEDSWLGFAGLMPDRAPRAVRLVFILRTEQVPDFLEKSHWRGVIPNEVITAIVRGSRFGDAIICSLHCDVLAGGHLGPRIGLEFKRRHWLVRRNPVEAWRGVIERLVEQGWCLPAKGRMLLGEFTPQSIVGGWGSAVLRAGLAHVKLVVDDTGEVVAKAYIGVAFFEK